MPEKTKPETKARKQVKKEAEKLMEEDGSEDEAAWSKDQREKSYYYDDAHGYEIYHPDEEDEED
jgi:hypothetical protein